MRTTEPNVDFFNLVVLFCFIFQFDFIKVCGNMYQTYASGCHPYTRTINVEKFSVRGSLLL